MQITDMSLVELAQTLKERRVSAVEATCAYMEKQDVVGAYLTRCEDALQQAKRADERRAAGEDHPLLGVPVAVKDNICTKGVRTTCASKMLEDFVPPYSATAWARMEQAGAVLLGKTNLDEFAMGSSTETSAFQVTRNPHDLSRVPGGSSGGSAACVAAGLAPLALGSDTGGSIRQPAALCGVVGMKPTYGAVSRYGLVAFASSLDVIGPMTRTVADNALTLDALLGADERDSTCVQRHDGPMGAQLEAGVKGLTIGLPVDMMAELSGPVRDAVEQAAAALEQQGAHIREVALPTARYALPAYFVLSGAEASSNLARFDGIRYGHRASGGLDEVYVRSRSEGFGPEVKRRMMLGTYALSAGYYDAYYKKAMQVRTLMMRDFDAAFETCDALLGPVTATTAWKIGGKTDPVEMYQSDLYTVPASMAGIPALSLPFGKDDNGLPIGVQLMGPAFGEPMLYRVARALEEVRHG